MGQELWQHRGRYQRCDADPAGNLYVTGFFSMMTVEGVTVTSKGLFDVFLLSLIRMALCCG